MKGGTGGQRLMLVGPLPPPATGQSVSFEMLCREARLREGSIEIVDLSRRGESASGRFSGTRAVEIASVAASFVRGLLKGCRRVYMTIAQSRAGFARDFLLIWSAAAFGARVVVHLKGGNYDGFVHGQPPWLRWTIKRTLRRVEKILVLGEGLRSMFAFDPELMKRTAVVPNGLPIAVGGSPISLPAKGAPIRILYLSNMIQTKGYWDVLRCVRHLKEEGDRRIEATFAGQFLSSTDDPEPCEPDEMERRFVRSINEWGLDHVARFVGPVYGDAKWRLLQDSHIFVLPTAYVNEGQPVSIIEAMAYGCVVVTTSFRAIPDMVDDGVTGVLVPYGRPECIAKAIRELSADECRFNDMSRRAVRRYEEDFSMQAHIESIMPQILGSF